MDNTTNPLGKDLITTSQGARLTGWSISYVRRLALQGRITGYKLGRDWWVLQDSLLAYKRQMDTLGKDKHNPWREDLHEVGKGRKSNE